MDFITVTPIYTVHQAVQLTEENLPKAAASLNGTLENGILSFTISNHTLYGMAGDWLVIFGTDVHVYTDKYYKRNYPQVDTDSVG